MPETQILTEPTASEYGFQNIQVDGYIDFLVKGNLKSHVRNAAHTFANRNGWRFKTWIVKGGIRVYRIQ